MKNIKIYKKTIIKCFDIIIPITILSCVGFGLLTGNTIVILIGFVFIFLGILFWTFG